MYKFINKKDRNVFYTSFFMVIGMMIALSVNAMILYNNGRYDNAIVHVILIIIGIIGFVYFHIQFSKNDKQSINKSLDDYR